MGILNRTYGSLFISIVLWSCQNIFGVLKPSDSLTPDRDTLMQGTYKGYQYLVLREVHNGTFGRFSMKPAVVKNGHDGTLKIWTVEGFPEAFLLARDTLYGYKSGERNTSGWFQLSQSHEISDDLPGLKQIEDSLKKKYLLDIVDANGEITLYKEGRPYKKWDYAFYCLTGPARQQDPNTLALGLYKLDKGALIKISNNPDDLANQGQGVYFLPEPGRGVLKSIALKDLFEEAEHER